MQNNACKSNNFDISCTIHKIVSIQITVTVSFWSDLMMRQHFLIRMCSRICHRNVKCLFMLNGLFNLGYCLSLLLLVSSDVMLSLGYHFIVVLLSVIESQPLSLCSISIFYVCPLEKCLQVIQLKESKLQRYRGKTKKQY